VIELLGLETGIETSHHTASSTTQISSKKGERYLHASLLSVTEGVVCMTPSTKDAYEYKCEIMKIVQNLDTSLKATILSSLRTSPETAVVAVTVGVLLCVGIVAYSIEIFRKALFVGVKVGVAAHFV